MEILSHPAIKQSYLLDDPCVERDDIYYLFKEKVGLFPCVKEDNTMFIHAAILPESRGIKAVRAAREAFKWIYQNTNVKRILSPIYPNQKHVRHFAKSVGMTLIGQLDDRIAYEAPSWADLSET